MRLDDFLSCFFPSETEPLFIRGFSPKELPEKGLVWGAQTTRQEIATNKEFQNDLRRRNLTQGLYFPPNSGGFKESEISRCNAVFCEIDDQPIPDQHEAYLYCPLPPSIQVVTKKSVHAYWLLDGPVKREEWYNIQCGLIEHFKSDAGIKNPNRVMRLPFFNHLSWRDGEFEYKRVEVHTFTPEARFTTEDLRDAFPYEPPPEEVIAKDPFVVANTMEAVAQELRYRISNHPSYKVEPDRVHGTCQGICHGARHGRTAIMVNLRTGAVFCHAGCKYWDIARAFGLEKPVGTEEIKNQPKRRGDPVSETGRRLFEYVYGDR